MMNQCLYTNKYKEKKIYGDETFFGSITNWIQVRVKSLYETALWVINLSYFIAFFYVFGFGKKRNTENDLRASKVSFGSVWVCNQERNWDVFIDWSFYTHTELMVGDVPDVDAYMELRLNGCLKDWS